MRIRSLLALAALSLPPIALLAACAAPPPPPPAAVAEETAITVTAVVESIDQSRRVVLLRGPEGKLRTVFVGEAVRNLAQVRAGDRVKITYRTAWAAEILPAGAPLGTTLAAGTARAAPGERPAGAIGGEIRTRVRIQAIDLPTNTVTFTRPDGMVREVSIRSATGQQFLRGLKPGDEVEIAYAEAVAVDVQPMK